MTTLYDFRSSEIESTLDPKDPSVIWIVVLGYVIAFFLAFGVGANDVANSFGTSVGSKVLTLRQACILATVFEIAGAMTMGYEVSSTIRTKIIYINMFEGEEKRLMLGYLAALIGGAIWNLVATFAGMPISGTHSIVGAMVGFSVVAKGFDSIKWIEIAKIVGSWFASPILSGIVSVLIFLALRVFILQKEAPLEPGLIALPLIYGIVVLINIFSIVEDDPWAHTQWYIALGVAIGVGLIIAAIVWFFVVPRQRKSITAKLEKLSKPDLMIKEVPKIDTNDNLDQKQELNHTNEKNPNILNSEDLVTNDIENGHKVLNGVDVAVSEEDEDDKPEVSHLFTFLQILTACFGAFAHGGNDVSNAIGPLVAIMLIFLDGHSSQTSDTPWYTLLYGGVGISVGLWVWGRKVIKTMGNDLTKITPSSGFTIEIGAASTVLVASKIGLPISTTHCKVGSVIMVGRIRNKQGVNWKLFRNIAAAWILTVPLTALCSAAAMALLQLAL